MYDPRLPCLFLHVRRRLGQRRERAPWDCRDLSDPDIRGDPHQSLTVAARGKGGANQGSQWPLAVKEWPDSDTIQLTCTIGQRNAPLASFHERDLNPRADDTASPLTCSQGLHATLSSP
jgi:hypothetical protein